ncbi:hypothetical protein M404DRAFT_1007792 [Pisolithus tinctorius Marx 270]|uniref:Uncharacterized protein n=1 Tax=Pisolithus tinctorius Marx 270 TaxID=870435 RepID=A0A0C3JBL9_PISTI|nr:hypothetical protein M404DRAFT_1007792 [Pisolithus tinctorius Marx 270]
MDRTVRDRLIRRFTNPWRRLRKKHGCGTSCRLDDVRGSLQGPLSSDNITTELYSESPTRHLTFPRFSTYDGMDGPPQRHPPLCRRLFDRWNVG